MRMRFAICLFLFTLNHSLFSQTMEDKVTVYLEIFLAEHKSTLTENELMGTEWATTDLMGKSKISFESNKKFKKEVDGFQAKTSKTKGRWYVNNEYVVLEVKKAKTPLYILKNENQIVLVDDDQIDVLKQLLTEASYKDDALKPYSYDEIFTFLNAFTVQ